MKEGKGQERKISRLKSDGLVIVLSSDVVGKRK